MSAVVLAKARARSVMRHGAWLIVGMVALFHISTVAVVKYGLPSFKPHKSEITIELGPAQLRGEGGTGARMAATPSTPVAAKATVQDDLATRRAVNTPKPAAPASAAQEAAASAAAGVDSAPTIDADYKAAYLHNPKPPYPPLAFQMRIEGTVHIKAFVQPDGTCGEVLLGRSSGNELLDQSALKTVAQWKFTPAQKQGKEIAQWVSIPISFALRKR